MGDALIQALLLRVQCLHQGGRTHDPGQMGEHVVAGDHPATLDGAGIEEEQREPLTDEHLSD